MNKKQRNRKLITQNKRNRMVNRRYRSTVKTLLKLFFFKLKNFDLLKVNSQKNLENTNLETLTKNKEELLNLVKNLYSIIDKATKKSIFHKNTAARKKSKIGKLSAQLNK